MTVAARGEAGRRAAWEDIYVRPETVERMLRWATTHASMVSALYGFKRILEVGTGTGMLSAFLARSGVDTATMDVSLPVLGVAGTFYERIGSPVARVAADAFAMPFAADAFDAVFSQGLWEHFDDDHLRKMVGEQLRVAPMVYASVPSAFYPHVGRRGPGLVGNERLLTRRRWRRILGDVHVEGEYYADWKAATFLGRTVPLPSNLLLTVSR